MTSFLRSLLPLLLLVLSLSPLPAATVAAPPPPSSEPVLVTFPHPGPEKLARLIATGIDVWGVGSEGVVALLTPDQVTGLKAQGIEVQPATPPSFGLRQFPFPACYRSFIEGENQLQAWVTDYPQFTALLDVGFSWETTKGLTNRRLRVMRITNEAIPGPKPKLLVVALHHAREIITPEVALNLIETLLTGYGQDADITWLVDQRELWVVPFANPDGHAKVQAGMNWRKNTNSTEPCSGSIPPNSFGVDLNRNYGFQWGGPGASDEPCNLTYRGTSPFSEPETQAIRDLINSQGFDMVISLHAFGDLILYPWGYTTQPAPDAAGLYSVARVLGSFNGYTPVQSVQLYPTNGDTCDWVYGTLGVPCLTFEIGSPEDGYFWPDCKQLQILWEENREALLYALKLVAAPYQLALGPRIRDLRLQYSGRTVTLQAVLDDQPTGMETVTGGEVFLDTVGPPGTGIPLTPQDSMWTASVVTATATLDLAGLTGRHTLYLFAEDELGHRSPPAIRYVEPCFDMTGDGEIEVGDVMYVAARWHATTAQADYSVVDLNADEYIDVQDVMLVAAQWGRRCNDGSGE